MDKGSPRTPKGPISSYASAASTVVTEKAKKPSQSQEKTLSEIKAMFVELKTSMEAVTKELKQISERQEKTEAKVNKLDTDQKLIKKRLEKTEGAQQLFNDKQESMLDNMAMLELKLADNTLRLRGIQEGEEGDNLKLFISKLLANLLGEDDLSVMMDSISACYRVSSAIAKQKKLPRDCIVQFVTRICKDIILKKQYESPIIIGGKKILMLKEIPGRFLKKRKDFAFLVSKLKQKKISFRWLYPQGVAFYYKTKRHSISDTMKAEQFLRKYHKDFDAEEDSQQEEERQKRQGHGRNKKENLGQNHQFHTEEEKEPEQEEEKEMPAVPEEEKEKEEEVG
ncbi:uncharacterized protein [Anolis sagrei]|uniref:uncharacterized protein n=1 Tax=Anolis sagrei TaxID=38937 RepID=UPI003521564E